MIIKSNASAVWNGSGKDGNGTLSTRGKALNNTPYSYKSRFEGGAGTNPEELVAAAHAGCFTMKLAFELGAAGFMPETLNTACTISFENGAVTASDLEVEAVIPGISKEKFEEIVHNAEKECPISRLLNAKITAHGTLKA